MTHPVRALKPSIKKGAAPDARYIKNVRSGTAPTTIARGESQEAAPIAAATPLPPLNLKKIGQLCPTTTAATGKTGMPMEVPHHAADTPFIKSIAPIIKPSFFPLEFHAFVAPAFFVPTARISIPRNHPTMIAVFSD